MTEVLHHAFVIGLGEVGRRLATALRAAGVDLVEVTRTAGWELTFGDSDAVRLVSVREEDRTEAEALFAESVRVCARALDVEPDPGWWPAFLAAAEPLSSVRTSQAKALDLRNRAVVRLARELGLQAPVNARLLAAYETRA